MYMQIMMKSDGIIFVYYQPPSNNKHDFLNFSIHPVCKHLQIISFKFFDKLSFFLKFFFVMHPTGNTCFIWNEKIFFLS